MPWDHKYTVPDVEEAFGNWAQAHNNPCDAAEDSFDAMVLITSRGEELSLSNGVSKLGKDGKSNTSVVELETKVHKVFIITENAPNRASSWLKVATTTFTYKNL